MKKRACLAVSLCLLMPLGAQAVTEGKVEEAPVVEMQGIAPQQEVSYLPDTSYYAGAPEGPSWENAETWVENESDEGIYYGVSQSPRLTAGEAKRAQALLEAYNSGEAEYTGESVLEKMEDVIVGVYALDPNDYDGETVYVLLPGTCLTDEQLLSIISAFDELGLTFDPEGLNYRNCARGGGMETTRFFTAEESERFATMAESIRRGQLTPPEGVEALVHMPKLNSAYFSGMTEFAFRPYRSMTDEELISLLLALGVHDESGETDYDDVENRSRELLHTVLGCPLSMELTGIYTDGGYVPQLFTADGQMSPDYATEGRASYGANFTYSTETGVLIRAHAMFDKETDELISLIAMQDDGLDITEIPDEPFGATSEKIEGSIASVEARLNLTDLAWQVRSDTSVRVIAHGDALTGLKWNVREADASNPDWGTCIPVRAQADEGWFFTLYIGRSDGEARGLELTRGTLVDVLPTLAGGE